MESPEESRESTPILGTTESQDHRKWVIALDPVSDILIHEVGPVSAVIRKPTRDKRNGGEWAETNDGRQ